MAVSRVSLGFIAIGIILQACVMSNSDSEARNDTGISNGSGVTLGFTVEPSYGLNKDASTQQRLAKSAAPQEDAPLTTSAPPTATSWKPAKSPAGYSDSRGYSVGAALLKSSAVASTNQFAPPLTLSKDTSWIRYNDSSKGYVQWLRTYDFIDSTGSGTGLDSIVYKHPYTSANPTAISHVSKRIYANGKTVTAQVFDDDGDAILNQAVAGKVVKLMKKWVTVLGDTTWKTITYTTHGQTTYYDSLGSGAPTSWTDSIFVKSKTIWWQTTTDGDGDKFILTHAGNNKTKVIVNSFRELDDGTLQFDSEIFGAGADGDYLTKSDNELYPYNRRLVSSIGKDQAFIHFGDADGDGTFWNPSLGTANKCWIKTEFAPGIDTLTHTDSLVEVFTGSGKLDEAKILYFSGNLTFKDGTASFLSTQSATSGFSGKDTVKVLDHKSYANYIPKGLGDSISKIDSTLRVTWILPNDLTTPNDDKIVRWLSETFYKTGNPVLSTVDLFTPDGGIYSGKTATAGTSIHQEIHKAVNSQSVIRNVTTRTVDPAKNLSDWQEIRYFENGDSSVTTGGKIAKGVGSYSRNLGPNIQSSGWTDANTGAFKDTLKVKDAAGKPSFEEYSSGILATSGLGEFDRTVSRLGVTTLSHIKVVKEGDDGLLLTRTSPTDTALIHIHGDTAALSKVVGGNECKYIWSANGDGTNKVMTSEIRAKDGVILSKGQLNFGEGGTGYGAFTPYVDGKAKADSKAEIRNDGAVFIDGIRVKK